MTTLDPEIDLDPTRDLRTLVRARKLGVQLNHIQAGYFDELTEDRRRKRIRSASMDELRAAIEQAEIAARKPRRLLLPWVRSAGRDGSYLVGIQNFTISSEPGVELLARAPFCFLGDDRPCELLDDYQARHADEVLVVDPDSFEADPVAALQEAIGDEHEAIERMKSILRGESGDNCVRLPTEMIDRWLESDAISEALRWELSRMVEAYAAESRDEWSFGVLHSWPGRGEKPKALWNEKDIQVANLKREAERQQAFYTQNPGAHPETVTAESLDGGAE